MRTIFIIAVLVAIPRVYVGFVMHSKLRGEQPKRQPELNSFGDPDGGKRSEFMREWQKFARAIDQTIYSNDVDMPGITFASPVEWAPWMETVWFGNYYEYRSAYFHDVMYSNNKEKREGALLFRNSLQTMQLALLYQRYKRFDQSSYSLSNATFFNVFGEQTLRLGRYKVPLTDKVLLCITDPLTTSDMKRYFNSFNALKWFKSKFMQQKRKRQYGMSVPLRAFKPLAPQNAEFFSEAVHKIEYGNAIERLGTAQAALPYTVPILACNLSKGYITHDITAAVHDTATSVVDTEEHQRIAELRVPLSVLNSQYIVESLLQTLLEHCSANLTIVTNNETHALHSTCASATSSTLQWLGVELHVEDGLLSTLFSQLLLRIYAANDVGSICIVRYGRMHSNSTASLLGPNGRAKHTDMGTIAHRSAESEYAKNRKGSGGGGGQSLDKQSVLRIVLTYPSGNQNITGTVGIAASVCNLSSHHVLSAVDPTESIEVVDANALYCANSSVVLCTQDWETVLDNMQSCTSVKIIPAAVVL